MKPAILYLILLFFVSDRLLAQTITYKDLIGTTWVLMDRSNQKESWEFLDSTNLYDRSFGDDNKPISRKLKYFIDKEIIKFHHVGSYKRYRYKLSLLNHDEIQVTFLKPELFVLQHKWIEQESDYEKKFVILRRKS